MFDLLQFNNSHLAFWDILLRLCLAAFLGGMIGIDREVRNRTAGLRTHMLTSLAAATFTIGAWEIFFEVRVLEQPVSADPIRIIEAVTAGVAFLAAGTIIHSSGKVKGLTTGASMWLAGAVGMVCGAGLYLLAAAVTGICFVILTVLKFAEWYLLETTDD